MKIVSTFHPSSSVLSSVKCRLGTRDLEHLVVAKLNRLDVYSLRTHGLQHECGLDVWGKICSLKRIPLYETRSNIAIMLTHPDPELIFLAYEESDAGIAQLTVKKQLSLFERLPRIAEYFTDFLIHPSGNLAVVSCYAAKLKVITLKGGNYQEDFDVSFPELNVLSLTFLPTSEGEYALGILYVDSQNHLQLSARDVDVGGLELSPQPSTLLQPTLISERVASHPTELPLQLIPIQPNTSADSADASVDPFPGGVMIVGGRQVLLFELASKESQAKQRGKQKRLEAKMKSADPAEVAKARTKEQERGFRKRKSKFAVDWPWSEVSAWCPIDGVPSRFLIGDSFGRLSMLSLDNITELGIILVPLGEVSPPTTLTYLTNQIIYVGSHLGDSQLVQISSNATSVQDMPSLTIPSDIKTVTSGSLMTVSSKKGKEKAVSQDDMDVDDENVDDYSKGRVVEPMGSFINVLDSYKNIAPIMDAISVDTDGSGQTQIVTCSGGASTGSVNVVRNGADFKELAFIRGLTDVTRIWSVRAMYDDLSNTHILISTVDESHLFRINDSGNTITLQREEFGPTSGFIANQTTLAFSNFYKRENGVYGNSRLVVQVVPTGAFLLEWDTTMKMYLERASWEVKNIPPSHNRPLEIVAASANASQVALALSGGNLVLLCIENNAAQFKQLATHVTHSEISAVSFTPLNAQKAFSSILTVAYWSSNIVELFTLAEGGLKSGPGTRSPPLPAVVRSLLLYNFGTDTSSKGSNYHPYLLAGLGDGSVASLVWKDGALKDLKITSLGHAPVSLTGCEVDGKKSVFAAGNRTTVFFCDKNRLVNSSILLKEISAASRLNTRTFTSALILATPTGLSIGSVKNLNKMHIRSAFFGLDNPRKITYQPLLKAFGVACTRIEPARIGSFEFPTSSFHLVDDSSLARLGQYKCAPNEEITSALTFKSLVENQEKPFFCLGTVVYKEEEIEPTSGRLLIFTAYTSAAPTKTSSLELSLVASAEVKGCVYALKNVEGKIVAAINSCVLLYQLDISSDESFAPTFSLQKLSDWNHNYMVTSLGSFDDRVVAGDQISSVSLLKVTKNRLTSEARDYGPLYPMSVEAFDQTNIIASNDTLNLVIFTLAKNLRGEALERIGFFHLADLVSQFVRGSLSSSDQTKDSKLKPEMLYFTSSGRIGVITDVEDKDLSLHLTELQRNLAAVIPGVGGTSHTRFRAPKDTRGPSDADGAAYGFLDGDFLEQYLGLQGSPDLLNKVMKGASEPERLKISRDEVLKILEQLQSLH
ncbi:CPSF A subunit region-domain-containing protein [Flammula alnicola]|nr:CPSF A subunit region-domain-containing protein [Flammula alnicola]